MARPAKLSSRKILQNRIESWASEFSLGNDPYISGLRSAIESQKELAAWSQIDPLAYLPHPEIANQKFINGISTSLTILRNALVFLPVGLTWYAISKATSAFSTYTSTNSLSVVNFLDFWENGYGVLSKKWALSNVATLDFQIILLIIAMTLTVSILHIRERKFRNEKEIYLESQRVAIALEISIYLNQFKKYSNLTFSQDLSRIMKNLTSVSTELKQSYKNAVVENNRSLKFKELTLIKSLLKKIEIKDK